MTTFISDVRRWRSQRSLILGGLAALIVAALLQAAAAFAAPGQTAIVRPDPLVATVPVGGQVVVNIYIQDVQNLYGADIRFSYDPAVLEVQDADPAASGVQIQPLSTFLKPDYVARNKACNVVDPADPACPLAGILRYAVTQINPSAPASGSGALAAITFKRLRPDVTTLEVITHDLSDRNGVTIPSTVQDGKVDLAVMRKLYLPLIVR
jgi:hypothetical protein